MKFPKINGTTVASVVVGMALVGLGIRYFGNKPVIEDIKKGLNGDVQGLFS